MIYEICDRCDAQFEREAGAPATCPNCGLVMERSDAAQAQPSATALLPRESAMLAPAAETAVHARPRPRKKRR